MNEIAQTLRQVLEKSSHWTELRYHRRKTQTFQVQKGLVKQVKSTSSAGVGIRVLIHGAWGFSSCSDLSPAQLERALKQAIECARSISQLKKSALKSLPAVGLAQGHFEVAGYEALEKMPLEQKLEAVIHTESETRKRSQSIQSANCAYTEIFEEKMVMTTDGANASSRLARNEFRISAVAQKDGELSEGYQTIGKTGAWECLFQKSTAEQMSEEAAGLAVDLLKAPRLAGGTATLILSPAMVGLLSHEAIGHTVEADFVLSGSVANGKLGTSVASELVTLCDTGVVKDHPDAGGTLLVDDEGVPTQNTVIIKNGVLNSFLHNRESAALFGVAPTGNARAWVYQDEPLIRMRNTYVMPGEESLESIIARTEDGYLVDKPLGGQADATGEFMFGAQRVMKIERGKVAGLYRGATISGKAFDVLRSVDAVSQEFDLDLGAGYCGKGQPAKVDAGGPFIRCQAIIGGMQK